MERAFFAYIIFVMITWILIVMMTWLAWEWSHIISYDYTSLTRFSATNITEALAVAEKIGYPVLVRAAYALGGLGSGFAENPDELRVQCEKAFAISSQILIDQDLRGWKEVSSIFLIVNTVRLNMRWFETAEIIVSQFAIWKTLTHSVSTPETVLLLLPLKL